jgi:hypothetical protein
MLEPELSSVLLGPSTRRSDQSKGAKIGLLTTIWISSALTIVLTSYVFAETCSLAVVHCKAEAIRHSDREEKCAAAGEQCKRTGTFIGPCTGKTLHGFERN